MRYNKQELYALASQTSQNFEREGVLVLKEKQDGFFRRAEGCTVRWFRLRGNLLFYLKGPEPWYEPMGVIVFGHHHVKVQPQDENGHWPFHIGWDNGVCYKMATFHESERMLWLKAIEMAPYDKITSQVSALRERLNKIRPNLDIAMYRLQKGIVPDMNEVPLCELALSCDNLLCDAYGHPPSPVCIIYVKYLKGLSVRYGSTEIVEKSSNPCFSKTILFRASDGLTGQAIVRIVVYDVKERVSETAVPIGFTSLQLSTIQEAQRLRVALVTRENKTVGFVTINGWSLEPSYVGTSPSHTTDKNIDIQKVLCHRRSQSLPPRLGLKLKFPCYGTLLKQNFANSTQVTYRFHSGLGGDITVHEVMAEAKICYQFPMQLLDIYIQREKELLEELLSVGEISGQWQTRQLDLVNTHVSLLKHYCHSKKCMQQVDSTYFKASARKADASLEFAPINMHIQRMWVHNDTLNKTGFHDVITVGAFAVHTHKSQRPVGLIRLLQQMKELSSTNAAYTHKIQVEYDKVLAMRQVNGQLITDMERINMMLQAKRRDDVIALLEGIKGKVKTMLSLWDPAAVEESLSYIRWPHDDDNKDNEIQAKSTIMRIMEQLSIYDDSSDCDTYDVSNMSSSSSKDTSPTGDQPSLSASVPNVFQNITDLHFDNDYFYSTERNNLNNSFRSMRSSIKPKRDGTSLSFDGSKRHGSMRSYVKSSASLGQDATKVMDGVGNDKRKGHNVERRDSLPPLCAIDPAVREKNLTYLRRIARNVDDAMQAVVKVVNESLNSAANVEDNLDRLICECDSLRSAADELPRWLRLSHASLRLRCEAPRVAGEHATLQTRRDSCFSQALTTLTTGLISWLSATPTDVIVKLLSSGLGPVCGFESLLSLHSTEAAMWGDMAVAVEDMHTAAICLTQRTHSNASIPHVTGTRGAITVHIPVSDALYSTLAKKHLTFSVTAVFFNIGVNEKATLAEALGQTLPQYHSNCDNWDRLSKYYNKYTKVITPDLCRTSSSRTKPLEEVMENLRIAIHRKVPKNVEILQLAALATRLMNGIRFTSCKSAKDRTGMSVTLEQCSILAAEYHLAEHEVKKALNIMRSEGCRRENTYKNIGVRKYAFTKTQVMALPEDYRPPPGTYGSSQT